jgi:hypothetical protein
MPKLAALGDQVTMFDASGWTDGGEAKFLRWNELGQMEASGHWDIQLHYDSRIPVELQNYFQSHFQVYFVQPEADPDFSTPGSEPHRYTIESTTTAADVYASLAEHA